MRTSRHDFDGTSFEFPLDLDGVAAAGRTRALHEALREAILDRRLRPVSELPSTRRVAAGLRPRARHGHRRLRSCSSRRATSHARRREGGGRRRRLAPGATRARLADGDLRARWQPPTWSSAASTGDAWTPGFRLGVPDHRADCLRRLAAPARARVPSAPRRCVRLPDPARPAAAARSDRRARVVRTRGRVPRGRRHRDERRAAGVRPARAAAGDAGTHGRGGGGSRLSAGGRRDGRGRRGLVPVPVDAEGLCVDALPRDARIVYVTPSHQYPTGVALSLARRRALLGLRARARRGDHRRRLRRRVPLRRAPARCAADAGSRRARASTSARSPRACSPSLRIGLRRRAGVAARCAGQREGRRRHLRQFAGAGRAGGFHPRRAPGAARAAHAARVCGASRGAVRDARRAAVAMVRRDSVRGGHPCRRAVARCGRCGCADATHPRARGRRDAAARAVDAQDALHGVAFGIGCIEEETIRERLGALANALRR